MNRRMSGVLAIALIVAAAASLLVYRLYQSQIAGAQGARATDLLVAARNLEIGTVIKDADVRPGKWVGDPMRNAILKKDAAVGRGVIAAIYEGEPILENRLAPAGSGGGLAPIIPAGMRACAVRVNEVVGLAGFVISGMRVDVLATANPAVSGSTPRTKIILQNIEVLSAGQNFQRDAEGKPVQVQVVNLLVTPEQAEILSLAATEAKIQLVMRNPLDTQIAKTQGTSVPALFGADLHEPAPLQPRPGPPVMRVKLPKAAPQLAVSVPSLFVVEVINGLRRTESKFEEAMPQPKAEQLKPEVTR